MEFENIYTNVKKTQGIPVFFYKIKFIYKNQNKKDFKNLFGFDKIKKT